MIQRRSSGRWLFWSSARPWQDIFPRAVRHRSILSTLLDRTNLWLKIPKRNNHDQPVDLPFETTWLVSQTTTRTGDARRVRRASRDADRGSSASGNDSRGSTLPRESFPD